MPLWTTVCTCLEALRSACTRGATFQWMMLALVGLCIRTDLAGVTSFVRAGWLRESAYRRLLYLFHSSALRLQDLTRCWVRLTLTLFQPLTVGPYLVCVADGLKVPKEGKKMPAVKSLFTESTNNSKPPFIMGHSFQAIALLVRSVAGAVVAVPLVSRIHEGLVFSNRDRRTLLDKLVLLFATLWPLLDRPLLLVADAFYASHKIATPLLEHGHHLVTRVRGNSKAYRPAPRPQIPRRGRPRLYGKKIALKALFRDREPFRSAPSPVYGEHGITIRYRSVDLVWRPVGRLVRFVLALHPTRGRIILMTTDLALEPLTVVRLYGYRAKIEVTFKQAIHTLGAYAYHFWMRTMTPIRRRSGNQFLHCKSESYRRAVRRKLEAYHRYAQLGCIAQGLLQHLSLNRPAEVWAAFRGWLRTIRPDVPPSEQVVAEALRTSLCEFLLDEPNSQTLKKFLASQLDPQRTPRFLKIA